MRNILFLLRLEWLKNRNYRPFWVLMALFGVMLPTIMYTLNSVIFTQQFGSTNTFFMFPNVWVYLSYIGNWLIYFLMGFIAVQAISTEVSNRTLRQNIISGLSRTDFFLSKFYFLTAVNLALTAYFVLWSLLFGAFHTETIFLSKVTENIDIVPRFFLMSMGFTSLGLFLGVLFRRSILGLFMYFTYIMFIERIIRFLLIGKLFGENVALFAPMNAVNDLTPLPLPVFVNSAMENSNHRFSLTPVEATITTLIYATLFFFGAFYLLKKRDL